MVETKKNRKKEEALKRENNIYSIICLPLDFWIKSLSYSYFSEMVILCLSE